MIPPRGLVDMHTSGHFCSRPTVRCGRTHPRTWRSRRRRRKARFKGGPRLVLLALWRGGEEGCGFAWTEQGQQRQEHCQEGDEGRGGGARRRDAKGFSHGDGGDEGAVGY